MDPVVDVVDRPVPLDPVVDVVDRPVLLDPVVVVVDRPVPLDPVVVDVADSNRHKQKVSHSQSQCPGPLPNKSGKAWESS